MTMLYPAALKYGSRVIAPSLAFSELDRSVEAEHVRKPSRFSLQRQESQGNAQSFYCPA